MANYDRLNGTGLSTLLNRLASVIKQGHIVVNSSGTSSTQREKLKFSGFDVADDSTNGATVVNAQCETIATKAIWNSMTSEEKNNPNKVYFLPWANSADDLEPTQLEIVSWSEGTDAQIAAMLEAHYNGDIDITDYWNVGDERTVSLSAMGATGVNESHRAQDVTMVILDFNHDDLTTPINGITKAAITIQQKNCLRDANVTDTNGSSNTEHGYMNSTKTNVGGWTSCARRTWCNDVYYNALPADFKDMVKQVNKLTSAGNISSTINTDADYCWLPSEFEIFGTTTYSVSGEGTQYSYYTTAANRYKLPRWDSSYVSDSWWLRSPHKSYETAFCRVNYNGGTINNDVAYTRYGLAPACCL